MRGRAGWPGWLFLNANLADRCGAALGGVGRRWVGGWASGGAVRNVYSVAGLNRFVLLTDFRTHTRLKNGQKLKTNSPSFSFIHWLALYWKKVFVRWKWQRRPKGLTGRGGGGRVLRRGDVKRTDGGFVQPLISDGGDPMDRRDAQNGRRGAVRRGGLVARLSPGGNDSGL